MADTVFIAMTPSLRLRLETTIEALVNLLDELDGDENQEETGDLEPNLGWCGEGRGTVGLDMSVSHDDEREQENEHGGDILDERHDEEGEREPFLGWTERCGQGPVVGVTCGMQDIALDDTGEAEGLLRFDGEGHRIAHDMLRNIRPVRDPDEVFFIAPGVMRIGGRAG